MTDVTPENTDTQIPSEIPEATPEFTQEEATGQVKDDITALADTAMRLANNDILRGLDLLISAYVNAVRFTVFRKVLTTKEAIMVTKKVLNSCIDSLEEYSEELKSKKDN